MSFHPCVSPSFLLCVLRCSFIFSFLLSFFLCHLSKYVKVCRFSMRNEYGPCIWLQEIIWRCKKKMKLSPEMCASWMSSIALDFFFFHFRWEAWGEFSLICNKMQSPKQNWSRFSFTYIIIGSFKNMKKINCVCRSSVDPVKFLCRDYSSLRAAAYFTAWEQCQHTEAPSPIHRGRKAAF